MKKNSIITVIFPALVMLGISLISFTDILSLSDVDAKGLIIGGLVIIFPIVFLIQGVACALTNTNISLSLIVSIATYILLMFRFLNSSAFGYIVVYLITWVIGYLLTKFFIKSKASKNN